MASVYDTKLHRVLKLYFESFGQWGVDPSLSTEPCVLEDICVWISGYYKPNVFSDHFYQCSYCNFALIIVINPCYNSACVSTVHQLRSCIYPLRSQVGYSFSLTKRDILWYLLPDAIWNILPSHVTCPLWLEVVVCIGQIDLVETY